MQLDASGPNILAAVSQNNPDDADHIGVIVPGMTTSVAGSLGEYDGHATTMRKSAETAAANGKRSPWLNSSATTRLPVLSRLPPPSWLTTAHRSSPASSTASTRRASMGPVTPTSLSPPTPMDRQRQESPQLWWEMASSTTWFNSARLARAFRTWVSSMSPKDTRTSAPHAHRFLEDP